MKDFHTPHSRDLHIKVNYFEQDIIISCFEGVPTQENNDLGRKRSFALLLLTVVLFCDHTSIQLLTTTNKISVPCLETLKFIV